MILGQFLKTGPLTPFGENLLILYTGLKSPSKAVTAYGFMIFQVLISPFVILVTSKSFRDEFMSAPIFRRTSIFVRPAGNLAFLHCALAAPFVLMGILLSVLIHP